MKKLAVVLFTVLALATPSFAQIKSIDSYVKSVERSMRKKAPDLVFADISDYNGDAPAKWQKFKSPKDLETFRTRNETYSIAYNWQKNGRIVRSAFTLFSPSGDWAQYDTYFFRANGKLAKIESEIRTFIGDVIIERNFYFNSTGKRIALTKKYRDLRSKKPIKKPSDATFDTDEIDVYKTVWSLPFAKLMRKR